MKKRVVALLMSSLMVFSLAACGGTTDGSSGSSSDTQSQSTTESQSKDSSQASASSTAEESKQAEETKPAETVVIRYGTHWVPELDPNHVDDVTGEYTMNETNSRLLGSSSS